MGFPCSSISLLTAALLLQGSVAVSFTTKSDLQDALNAFCGGDNSNGPVNDWDVSAGSIF